MKAAGFDCSYQSTFIPSPSPFSAHCNAVILLGRKYEIIHCQHNWSFAWGVQWSQCSLHNTISLLKKNMQYKHSPLIRDTCSLFTEAFFFREEEEWKSSSLLSTVRLSFLCTPLSSILALFYALTLKGDAGQIRCCKEHLHSVRQADTEMALKRMDAEKDPWHLQVNVPTCWVSIERNSKLDDFVQWAVVQPRTVDNPWSAANIPVWMIALQWRKDHQSKADGSAQSHWNDGCMAEETTVGVKPMVYNSNLPSEFSMHFSQSNRTLTLSTFSLWSILIIWYYLTESAI